MNLQEYILIPVLENVVLPYENTTLIISNIWKNILQQNTKMIVGFYKVDSLQNTVLLNHNEKIMMISKYATLVSITNIIETENNEIEVTIQGLHRVLVISTKIVQQQIIMAEITNYNPVIPDESYREFDDMRLSICDIIRSQKPETNIFKLLAMSPLEFFYYSVKDLCPNNVIYKQSQLEEDNIIHGLQSLVQEFFHLNSKFKDQIEQEVYKKVKEEIEKHQKKYLLDAQMNTIKKELEKIVPSDENNIEEEIKNHPHLPEAIKKTLLKEYEKIRHNNPLSSEYTVTKNYLTTSLSLPWGKFSDLSQGTLKEAEDILNKDHYGLDDIKDNILEYLATAFKTHQNTVKVLLLVGPPGVGKTSIGSSIAKCLKRQFVFISLTSVSDMADLVGHRRTYVGSYPGLLITKMIEAGVSNPLIFLDEVDKMKRNYTDPSNILVPLLDPTQNHNFTDNFLGYPFDMSKAIFVLTANTTDSIPDYLLSRMEVVRIDGYTIYDKIHIAKDFLIPKLYKELSITKEEITITDEAIKRIIKHYTREMGVRYLNKLLSNILSKSIYINMKNKETLKKEPPKITISLKNLNKFTNKMELDFSININHSESLGLAWTSVGGDLLKIQALFLPSSKGEVVVTGNLGQVMQESVKVAYSLVKQSSLLATLDINESFFNSHNLHIHVPEGGVPKDGPSAGVTIYTAILLAIKNKKSPPIAMTGEISLSKEVLPIGGIKQKLLAALMYGIHKVIVPKKNQQDVKKIKNFPFNEIQIYYISSIEELELIIFS